LESVFGLGGPVHFPEFRQITPYFGEIIPSVEHDQISFTLNTGLDDATFEKKAIPYNNQHQPDHNHYFIMKNTVYVYTTHLLFLQIPNIDQKKNQQPGIKRRAFYFVSHTDRKQE
jgi:hypothetical protein